MVSYQLLIILSGILRKKYLQKWNAIPLLNNYDNEYIKKAKDVFKPIF